MLNIYWCNTRGILLNGNVKISGIIAQVSKFYLRGAVHSVGYT